LFYQIIDWLLTLEEVPDEKMEAYCGAGELLSKTANQKDTQEIFQKLRTIFREEGKRSSEINIQRSYISQEIAEAQLSAITDFSAYIDNLKSCADRYAIFIVSQDTPWGPGFKPELTQKLMSLGLRYDLYRKFRCGYVAAIVDGKNVGEQLTPPTQGARCSGTIGKTMIELLSRGYLNPPIIAKIEIDGHEYSVKSRGLNIVVYDYKKNILIDSVSFDTYTDTINCNRPNYLAEALKKWSLEHPEVALICFKQPSFPQSNWSPSEKFIVDHRCSGYRCIELFDYPELPLRRFFERKEDVVEVLTPPKSYFDAAGVRKFVDQNGVHVHTATGHRVTTDQPEYSERTIYLVGGCNVFGFGISDKGTIASYLQRLCNEKADKEHFIVQNYGYYLAETDKRSMEEMSILKSLPLRPRDVVICSWGFPEGIPIVDLSAEGKRPHRHGELFFDAGHPSEEGCCYIARELFNFLQKENFYPDLKPKRAEKITMGNSSPVPGDESLALQGFQNQLKELYDRRLSVGAIVMNCNPFTLGHRYLIEQASKQCAHLIVFVVEEDLSVFPFRDRLELVKEGTSDLKNVIILPSGQFILSSLTFSEYFNKSELQDRIVDPSTDINLFAKEIAPCLHITKRFVGDEPIDSVTRQYNNEMQNVLPKYGIDYIQIQRLERRDADGVISASEVRHCIADGDMDAVKAMVPAATFKYINEHFEKLRKDIGSP